MKAKAAVATLVLLLGATARSDTVSMPEKIELSGKKVQILEIRDGTVLVRVVYGDILLQRARITAMKVNFPERLATLKESGEDTPRALYDLGRVCSRLEMPKEAATAYREALDRKGVPDDLLLPLATELERCDDWAGAQKCYGAYLKLHPDSAEAAAKARAAASKAADAVPIAEPPAAGDVKIEITSVPRATTPRPAVARPVAPVEPGQEPAAPGPEAPAPEAPGPQPAAPQVQEGLEAEAGWATEAWGSSVEVSVAAQPGSTDKLVRVFLAGAEQDKACVMLEKDLDLSDKKELVFDVYNFGKQSVSLAVAFTTAPGWKFYESSPTVVMPTGDAPKTITLDLTNNRYKCAETQWRHKSVIENRKRVCKIFFLLYTRQTNAWLFFNNIRFVAEEPAPAAPAAPAAAPAAPAPAAPAPAAPAPAPNP